MWLRGPENKINRMFYRENYFKGPGYIYLKGWVVVSLLNHLKSYNNFSSWVWMRKNHPIFIKASLSPVTLIAADKFFLRTYLICRAAVVLCGCARDKKKKKTRINIYKNLNWDFCEMHYGGIIFFQHLYQSKCNNCKDHIILLSERPWFRFVTITARITVFRKGETN